MYSLPPSLRSNAYNILIPLPQVFSVSAPAEDKEKEKEKEEKEKEREKEREKEEEMGKEEQEKEATESTSTPREKEEGLLKAEDIRVPAGTMNSIVGYLIEQNMGDDGTVVHAPLLVQFLLAYRQWMTPTDLFNTLLERFFLLPISYS